MRELSNWETIFRGTYGDQELTILYSDDYFVSYLKPEDKESFIIQLYKVFLAHGELELFVETLPTPCIFYQKHLDLGEKNTHKFFILNSETEVIDSLSVSSYIERKIAELNKQTSSIVSVIKSYNVKLISLKMLPEEQKNIFFSDPFIIKTMANFSNVVTENMVFAETSSINKLTFGKKEGVTITGNLESLRSVMVTGAELDDRLYSVKFVCENYLLSGKKVIVFDDTGVFKSLSYPQQNPETLLSFDVNLSPFGFPSKFIDYFKIKIPLSKIPKKAFSNMFKFVGISEKIMDKAYTSDIVTIHDLKINVDKLKTDDEITEFEKKRVLNKLSLLEEKYKDYFGKTDSKPLFEHVYKQIGSCKIVKIDVEDPFYIYYVAALIKEIENNIKEDILVAFPEGKNIFNSLFVGNDIFKVLVENPKISHIISSEYFTDFITDHNILARVFIEVINSNDVVIKYPNRDPLRFLLRPTLTSSNIPLKE